MSNEMLIEAYAKDIAEQLTIISAGMILKNEALVAATDFASKADFENDALMHTNPRRVAQLIVGKYFPEKEQLVLQIQKVTLDSLRKNI
jgi:hypothetical protein